MSVTMPGEGDTRMYETQSILFRCSQFYEARKTTASKVSDTRMETWHEWLHSRRRWRSGGEERVRQGRFSELMFELQRSPPGEWGGILSRQYSECKCEEVWNIKVISKEQMEPLWIIQMRGRGRWDQRRRGGWMAEVHIWCARKFRLCSAKEIVN